MKIPFKKLVKRINGISTPVFGISWNPSESEREKARKLIIYLEDKRALYYPFDMEIPYHVNESILEIRKYLTEFLQDIEENSTLVQNVRSMRAACRKYLDVNPKAKKKRGYFPLDQMQSLIEFRTTVGNNLTEICVKYGLDLNDDFEEILPIEDTD